MPEPLDYGRHEPRKVRGELVVLVRLLIALLILACVSFAVVVLLAAYELSHAARPRPAAPAKPVIPVARPA